MSNNLHPTDDGLETLGTARPKLIRRLSADGVLCSEDRKVIAMFDAGTGTIAHGRRIERATDFLIRARGKISRYGQDLFHDAGLKIIDLAAERSARKVANIADYRSKDEIG